MSWVLTCSVCHKKSRVDVEDHLLLDVAYNLGWKEVDGELVCPFDHHFQSRTARDWSGAAFKLIVVSVGYVAIASFLIWLIL